MIDIASLLLGMSFGLVIFMTLEMLFDRANKKLNVKLSGIEMKMIAILLADNSIKDKKIGKLEGKLNGKQD